MLHRTVAVHRRSVVVIDVVLISVVSQGGFVSVGRQTVLGGRFSTLPNIHLAAYHFHNVCDDATSAIVAFYGAAVYHRGHCNQGYRSICEGSECREIVYGDRMPPPLTFKHVHSHFMRRTSSEAGHPASTNGIQLTARLTHSRLMCRSHLHHLCFITQPRCSAVAMTTAGGGNGHIPHLSAPSTMW